MIYNKDRRALSHLVLNGSEEFRFKVKGSRFKETQTLTLALDPLNHGEDTF
jgi:uncharacterized protein YxjI